ncbi:tail fiber domain-containing protein [Paraburkholderia tropica]|uniref:tail fiber domain-containing protein n=1 Tax=Paraburkholderia tropica TaxID=92647 RepID=UPI003D2797DE
MTALQTVNLGTAPTGTDGDTVRVANVKANANVAVLNTQATLTSTSPNAVRDLTAADMGKRVNFTPTAAGTVHFPAANSTGADQLVAIHNLSATYDITMAIAAGSGDAAPTVAVVKPGEMLTYETDGVSIWRTIGRKKSIDEIVQGKLSVVGASTFTGAASFTAAATLSGGVSGDLSATGKVTGGSFAIGTVAAISAAGAYSGASASFTGALSSATLGVTSNATVGGTLGVTGQATFTLRPTFASNTPWDSGNFTPANYAPLNAAALTGAVTVNGAAWTGSQFSVRNASSGSTWAVSAYAVNQVGGCYIGRTDSSAVPLAAWFFGSTNVGTITTNGTTTTYGTGSDYRLKDGIEDLDGDAAIALIKEGRPRKYWMKADPEKRTNYGFIAHEYALIQPEAVVGEKDAMGPRMAPGLDGKGEDVDAPDEPRYQHMDYSRPTPILWAALKRALEKIDELRDEVSALRAAP